ncbi:hypothetical protein DQ239_18755 [Blastococcus sp. TF02-09]|uniref:hypothetical protein n=1 Tax=Blastococcus sp. TF02-09 TaxID=2250576 RepID=UPI000DEA6730|nr:hypothetical protein [Blastococcus sp. TF02-9]RBY74830.1 hypothetical protein DQ239_18755 [Blastococcus sp. TF02-9]
MTLEEDRTTSPGGAAAAARLPSLLRRLAFVRLALAGQVLTFAAMVVPILLRRSDQVLILVFASAITVLLTNAAMLAYPFLYPVVRGPRMARVATVWSLVALVVVSAAVVLATPLEPVLDLPSGTFLAAAVLTGTLGLYDMAVTRVVRADDTTGIGLARLYYGVAVLVLTLITSLGPFGPLALTFGTSLAYAVAAAGLAVRRQHWGPRLPRASRSTRRRLRRAYLARSVRPAVASLAGGWTVFLPGLAIPGLGAAAEPWAIVSRICGGFATVLYTIVAPPFEARLSQAVRERRPAEFAAARRRALLLSTAVAVLAVVAGLALAAYSTERDAVAGWFLPLAGATLLFWGPLLAGATINRLPNFLGRDRSRLYWDAGRAVLVTGAFLATSGVTRLIGMGAVLTLSAVLLLPMSRWPAASLPRS